MPRRKEGGIVKNYNGVLKRMQSNGSGGRFLKQSRPPRKERKRKSDREFSLTNKSECTSPGLAKFAAVAASVPLVKGKVAT